MSFKDFKYEHSREGKDIRDFMTPQEERWFSGNCTMSPGMQTEVMWKDGAPLVFSEEGRTRLRGILPVKVLSSPLTVMHGASHDGDITYSLRVASGEDNQTYTACSFDVNLDSARA